MALRAKAAREPGAIDDLKVHLVHQHFILFKVFGKQNLSIPDVSEDHFLAAVAILLVGLLMPSLLVGTVSRTLVVSRACG